MTERHTQSIESPSSQCDGVRLAEAPACSMQDRVLELFLLLEHLDVADPRRVQPAPPANLAAHRVPALEG